MKVGKDKIHVPGRWREIKKSPAIETYPTTHFFSNGKLLLTHAFCHLLRGRTLFYRTRLRTVFMLNEPG